MIYNIDYFISKFEAIPSRAIISCFINSRGGKCANGHCGVGMDYVGTEESHALEHLLCTLSLHWNRSSVMGRPLKFDLSLKRKGHYVYSWTAEAINDNLTHEYQQRTPKQRILAALRDVKKMQEDQQVKPDEKEVIIKHKITYVVIPESVSKEMKKRIEETVLS